MSTKVYRAYRLKDGVSVWGFIREVKPVAERNVRRVLRAWYLRLIEMSRDEDVVLEHIRSYGDDFQGRLSYVSTYVYREYRKQLSLPDRNLYDLDVYLTFREAGGRVYVIPRCDMLMRRVLDFLDTHPMCENFAYWDNTDPDEDVPPDEWEARGEVWDRLSEGSKWRESLVTYICGVDEFVNVDPRLRMVQAYSRWRRTRMKKYGPVVKAVN